MAYCSNCGAQLEDGANFCPNCGAPQSAAASPDLAVKSDSYDPYIHNTASADKPAIVDNGGFGWGLLGFCLPLVGLILFLVWRDNKPKTSKAAGKGALACVICFSVIYAIIFIIGICAAVL